MYAFITIMWICSVEVPVADLMAAEGLLRMPVGTVQDRPELRPAIVATCRNWQIMDKWDQWHFTEPENFQANIDAMRTRYEELRDTPRIENIHWLPSADCAKAHVDGCITSKERLRRRAELELDRASHMKAIIQDLEREQTFWQAVQDARYESYSIVTRRFALARLRQMVGADNFDRGLLLQGEDE